MTQQNQTIQSGPVAKRMLVGATIAFALIALFVFSVDNPKPEWGKFWQIKPLVVTTLAGAAGGLVYYYITRLGNEGGWKKVLVTIFGVITFIIILWLGSVLGMDGTLWN